MYELMELEEPHRTELGIGQPAGVKMDLIGMLTLLKVREIQP